MGGGGGVGGGVVVGGGADVGADVGGTGDEAGGVDESVGGCDDVDGAGLGAGLGVGLGAGCGCGLGFGGFVVGGLGCGVRGGLGGRPEPPGRTVRPAPVELVTTATCRAASADACDRRCGAMRFGALTGRSGAAGCPNVICGSGATCSAWTATGAGEDGSSTARQR